MLAPELNANDFCVMQMSNAIGHVHYPSNVYAQQPDSDGPRGGTMAKETTVKLKTEHDSWFRAEVARGMREANDPQVKRIPHEEIVRNWRRQRTALAKRAGREDE
ncbi:hypothetical protein [Vineibacter terrae]|uniref:hypothetical protein n=1 Tax=Vineibacter terrae TaxID=2586908 RepID=UPI001C4985BF|nr:hypothetical protein [Vineibacter terrae]